MNMGKIVVTEFVSLDGVMEAPGGGEDFKHAGWTFKINRGEEGDQFKLDETRETEALLLGGPMRALPRPGRRGRASSPTNSTACPSTSSPRPSRSQSGTTQRFSRATWWRRSGC